MFLYGVTCACDLSPKSMGCRINFALSETKIEPLLFSLKLTATDLRKQSFVKINSVRPRKYTA